MTNFGEEYSLDCISIKKFFRLPITYGKNHFLINVGTNSVVKIRDRKLLHSWTLTHPHCFTTPVVFSENNESLYSILDNDTLIYWSVDDDTLLQSSKLKLREPVFTVLPIPGQGPLILFCSGKYLKADNLGSDLEPEGSTFLEEKEELIWADATIFESKVTVICLGQEGQSYKLHCFTINEDTSTSDYYCVSLLHERGCLRNWCFNKHNSAFLTIWSDGTVQSSTIFMHTQSYLISIPAIEKHNLLCIDVVDANHLAVGKSGLKQKETIVEIWDTKFGTVKARKNLKMTITDCLQMSVINCITFLPSNEDTIAIPLHIEGSTLAAAIGKSTSISYRTEEFSWSNKGELMQMSSQDKHESKGTFNSLSPIKHSPGLTEAIAQRLMEEGSAYLKYIPESELVNLLVLSMRNKTVQMKDISNSDPYSILNKVFAASFSDVFLVKYLKRLKLEEILASLELLLSFLEKNVPLSSKSDERPTDLQLFNWICLIIQSHMEALLLSKDKKTATILRKLDESLSQKMEEYKDFETIQHYIFLLRKKEKILPKKYVVGKYCIESLDT